MKAQTGKTEDMVMGCCAVQRAVINEYGEGVE